MLIGWFGFDELRVFRVKGDGANGRPVAGVASPAPWVGPQ